MPGAQVNPKKLIFAKTSHSSVSDPLVVADFVGASKLVLVANELLASEVGDLSRTSTDTTFQAHGDVTLTFAGTPTDEPLTLRIPQIRAASTKVPAAAATLISSIMALNISDEIEIGIVQTSDSFTRASTGAIPASAIDFTSGNKTLTVIQGEISGNIKSTPLGDVDTYQITVAVNARYEINAA